MLYKRLSSKRDSRKDILLIKHSHKVHTQKAHAVMLLSLCALPEHFAKHDVGMQTKYSFLKKFLLSLGISFKHILHNSCFRLAFTRIKYLSRYCPLKKIYWFVFITIFNSLMFSIREISLRILNIEVPR
jgi:hypothetical protein